MIKLQIPEGSTIFFGLVSALRRILGMYSCEEEIPVGLESDGAHGRVDNDTAKASIMALSREVAVAKVVLDRDGVPRLHKAKLIPQGMDAYEFVSTIRPCFTAYATGKSLVAEKVTRKKSAKPKKKVTKDVPRAARIPSGQGLLAASVFTNKGVREQVLEILSRVAPEGKFSLAEFSEIQASLPACLRECSQDSLRLYLERVFVVDGALKLVGTDKYRLADAASDDGDDEDGYWERFGQKVARVMKTQVAEPEPAPAPAPVLVPDPIIKQEPAPILEPLTPEQETVVEEYLEAEQTEQAVAVPAEEIAPSPAPDLVDVGLPITEIEEVFSLEVPSEELASTFDLEPEEAVVAEAVATAERQMVTVESSFDTKTVVDQPDIRFSGENAEFAEGTRPLVRSLVVKSGLLSDFRKFRIRREEMVTKAGPGVIVVDHSENRVRLVSIDKVGKGKYRQLVVALHFREQVDLEACFETVRQAVGQYNDAHGHSPSLAEGSEIARLVMPKVVVVDSAPPAEPENSKLTPDTAEVLMLLLCVGRGDPVITSDHLLALWKHASKNLKARGGKVVAQAVDELGNLGCIKRLSGQRFMLSPDAIVLAKKLAQAELAK